jgi:inner membrane protein
MKFDWKNSPGLKILIIGLLMLVFSLPSSLIVRLIEERQARQTETMHDISSTWGGEQKLVGPLLIIPYEANGQSGSLKILPEDWTMTGELLPEIRHRGLFSTVVYDAGLNLSGRFLLPSNAESCLPAEAKLKLDQALLVVAVSQQRSLAGPIAVKIDGKDLPLRPGLPAQVKSKDFEGFHVRLGPDLKPDISFVIDCRLHGSGSFDFLPSGRHSEIELTSPWTSPSYHGAFSSKHEETANGFKAHWSVQDLQRGLAQNWLEDKLSPGAEFCGVDPRVSKIA